MAVTETNLGFKERWLVADLLLKRPKPELGDHTIQYCNPERPATYARGPGDRRRWEIAVRDDEQTDAICRPDAVWPLLQRWIDPDEAELERAAVYTFQSIVADQWRKGRLLIAGDAAHRTPPFMGQGMCAGVRDAANLAWKLALAAKGLAPASILDSYGTERAPHAREYIETAVRLGRLINASGTREALGCGIPSAGRQCEDGVDFTTAGSGIICQQLRSLPNPVPATNIGKRWPNGRCSRLCTGFNCPIAASGIRRQ